MTTPALTKPDIAADVLTRIRSALWADHPREEISLLDVRSMADELERLRAQVAPAPQPINIRCAACDKPATTVGGIFPGCACGSKQFNGTVFSAAPAQQAEALNFEQRRAIHEAERNVAADAWFHARADWVLDCPDARRKFEAGFDAGAALASRPAPSLTVGAGVVPEVAESMLLGQAQQLIGALMNHGLLPKTADEASYLKLWDVVKRQLRCVNQEGGRAALAAQPAALAEPAAQQAGHACTYTNGTCTRRGCATGLNCHAERLRQRVPDGGLAHHPAQGVGDERKVFEADYRRRHDSRLYCESEWRGWQARAALAMAQLPAGGVDCIGLALDLEQQSDRVQSQTAERAMLAAAHGLRLIAQAQKEQP